MTRNSRYKIVEDDPPKSERKELPLGMKLVPAGEGIQYDTLTGIVFFTNMAAVRRHPQAARWMSYLRHATCLSQADLYWITQLHFLGARIMPRFEANGAIPNEPEHLIIEGSSEFQSITMWIHRNKIDVSTTLHPEGILSFSTHKTSNYQIKDFDPDGSKYYWEFPTD